MIILYKPLGITPYQAIIKLKEKNPELYEKKLSYAGRLDPMAEGLLLILVDDENKSRRQLEHFDKTYEFEALLGFKSDTYDILGLADRLSDNEVEDEEINNYVSKNTGKFIQKYPPFSAIKVDGKPLYWWARQNIEVNPPEKEIEIKSFEALERYEIDKKSLETAILSKISLVKGDFRQGEIIKRWKDIFSKIPNEKKFSIYKFKLKCSRGGYIRGVVNELGNYLGCGALAYSIKRVEIGEFTVKDAIYPFS